LLALAFALLGLAPAARAGVILQPASASTNMGTDGGSPNSVRNQSGLSAGYTSGVTDFDSYIAGSPTHNGHFDRNIWASARGTTTGNFDFALGAPQGGTFTVESFALWNFEESSNDGVRGFELLASTDASFSSGTTTSLGTFTASRAGLHAAVPAQVFHFAPTSAAFVRMVITSNYGDTQFTGFGEAAFEVQSSPAAVPEPGSLALLGLGALSLAGYARRRTAA
jgi:hypothetical protein